MAKQQDPNSLAAKLRVLSAETGIPANVLRTRIKDGTPMDLPYRPRGPESFRAQVSKALKLAQQTGKTRYEGSPCFRCGGTTRFTTSRACVKCCA